MMRVLALVTARGGSKGFPGKNLAPLAGRPLVTWSYRLLERWRRSNHGCQIDIRLSTDDAAIAAAWPEHARPVDLRPDELATDTATSMAVVRYEIERARERGEAPDAMLLIQPTTPLLLPGDLDAMLARLHDGADSVALISRTPHPVQWAWKLDEDGRLHAHDAEALQRRRQELEPSYLPVGIYAARCDWLMANHRFAANGVSMGVAIPATRAVDIDHAWDLDVARALLPSMHAVPDRFRIGERAVGGDAPCLVIAEAGVNHDGDLDRARALIDAAASAGADAVKFQTFRAADLATAEAASADYQRRNTGRDESQLAMLQALELGPDAFAVLKRHAEEQGLIFLSSPFDAASATLLAELGVAAFKIGSGELTNHPLLRQVAGAGVPLICSTGMAELDEVEDAVAAIADSGTPLALLHCVSTYPAPEAASNLRAMDSLRLACGGVIGMSDHALGTAVAVAAVARGAAIIEKHLTLDRNAPGPDHAASIETDTFAAMVRDIRLVESALGDGRKQIQDCERSTRAVARKSLVALRDLPAGHTVAAEDLASKRPGTGIAPSRLRQVVGRRLRRPLAADALLAWEDLA